MVIAAGQTALASDVLAGINAAEADATTAKNAATAAASLASTANTNAATALTAADTASSDAATAKAGVGGLQQQITNDVASTSANKDSIDTHTAQIGALAARIAALEGTAPPAVPNAPTAPTSTAVTDTSVSLSATAPASGPTPTSYKWEYKRSVDTAFTTSTVVTLTGTQAGLAASTSYDFRVSAVNAAGPSVPSSVYTVSTGTASVLVESAHGTTVTTPTSGTIIDQALNVWTLITATGGKADYQLAINGVRQTITGAAVLMKYYNPVGPAATGTTKHQTVHQNTAGDWYISTGVSGNIATFSQLTGDPDTATTPPPSTGTPAAATAAGYTTQVYGPTITLGTSVFKYSSDVNATQNADGSITTTGGGNTWGQQVMTAIPTGGANWSGSAWGGGAYFEWTMSFTGTANPTSIANGWPSLFLLDVEGPSFTDGSQAHWQNQASNYYRWMTINVAEWANDHTPMSAANTVYHEFSDFYGIVGSDVQAETGYNANGSPYVVPSGFDFSQLHRYGFLWVPATSTTAGYARYYVDDVRVDTGVAVWNAYNPATAPPPAVGSTAFSVVDARHLAAVFGTGPQNPLTVSKFSVWQKPGTTTPPPSGDAPSPAVTWGYLTRTFGPGLVIGSRGTSGANWYPTTNSGSVQQLSGQRMFIRGGSSPFNYEVVTAEPEAGMNGAGNRSFGGGMYVEALIAMENPGFIGGPTGWPGWWANDMEGQTDRHGTLGHWPGMPAGYGMWFEPDFMEFQGATNQYGVQVHNWYSNSDGPDYALDVAQINIGSNNIADAHYYGWLWVPATRSVQGRISWWFDRVERTVFRYNFFDRNNPTSGPPDANNACGGMDTTPNDNGRHFQLILGTGDNNSFTVNEVSVWQANGNKNLFT